MPGPPRGNSLPPGVWIPLILTLLSMGSGTIKSKIMPNPCEPRREGRAWGRGHRSRLRVDDGSPRPRFHSSRLEVSETQHNENIRSDETDRSVTALVVVPFRSSDRVRKHGLSIASTPPLPVPTGSEGTLHWCRDQDPLIECDPSLGGCNSDPVGGVLRPDTIEPINYGPTPKFKE